MKIACSSATFARPIAAGELTQLEWLDLCANELEVDGVVFDVAQFPRTDLDYLAQLKKVATDLGLSVAALAASDVFGRAADDRLAIAVALGAPVIVSAAPPAADDPTAWGTFADAVKACARAAKFANVTLALRNAPGTLCADGSDLKRIAKDVDSAWLRFAYDGTAFSTVAPAGHGVAVGRGAPSVAAAAPVELLAKSVIAMHSVSDLTTFATPGDREAPNLIASLARFRGFIVLESALAPEPRDAYHHAVERFASQRANALVASASAT